MTTTGTRTAAHLLVDCLAAEGCEYVFSVPGEETMDVLDALSDHRAVRHITTRHEQGAAFMADVYGRLTGRAAVAMATLGPGATNLVTGIADAHLDRAPMVAITGQASSDKLHKEAHQVVDIVGHARSRDEVEHERPAGRGDPRDRAQGVPGRDAREARPDAHRAAREPRRDGGRRRCRADPARQDLLPRADRRGDRPRRRPHRGVAAAARPRRQRRAAAAGVSRAAGVRPRPARPGRGHVHGQGRRRRPLAPVAHGRRACRPAITS